MSSLCIACHCYVKSGNKLGENFLLHPLINRSCKDGGMLLSDGS